MSSERLRLLLLGAVLGAGVGLVAAWVATDAKEEQKQLMASGLQADIRPNAKQWVSFGVAAVTLLRLFSEMVEPKKKKKGK